MADTQALGLSVVCLASYFKGGDFMRECKRQGCRVLLVTKEKYLYEDWPRECLDDIISVPDEASPELCVHTVTQIARHRKIDRLVALEEFDVVNAGLMREHLRLDGMTSAEARIFRDKLAMRGVAQAAGLPVPDFVHVLNYDALRYFMESIQPPWVMKPRSDVSAMGIKKMEHSEQVWRAIDELDRREPLRERSSFFLLERFVPGDVFHVDSLIENGKVIFAGANGYGRPPMDVAQGGGVFLSHTLEHDSEEQKELLDFNQRLVTELGLERGAAHAEFIKGREDGRFYFLEIAARVGGAYIAEVLEASSGVNIWREWANLEIAGADGVYELPPTRREYGGIALSLARQEYPDTSTYADAEIVYRVKKRHHVGLVVRSPELARVKELLDNYARRFAEDFVAVAPLPDKAE
ncbi:MAG: ATP-grasp domain-containing protein [Pyrinomonadaceae bacterium]|nr:ATP-grasp domain-containing protein [Pyrinomonadaceae bacterium]